jgi:predicted lipoprotein with Yx(FWY)xxD motif
MDSSQLFDRRGLATIAVVLAGILILAGCGGDDSGSDSSSTAADSGSSTAKTSYGYGSQSGTNSSDDTANAASGGSTAGSAATISAASAGDLGKVLVDGQGMTVYLFEKDENGKSACYGACADAWPPVTTEVKPVAKGSAMAGKLGTTKRTDGTTQVTYAGWPLYLYAGDSKPGQASGNDVDGFGAEWYALTPSGQKPED